jgi:hypothetical protein
MVLGCPDTTFINYWEMLLQFSNKLIPIQLTYWESQNSPFIRVKYWNNSIIIGERERF